MIPDEVGKAASATVDALKSTPMILGILLFNLLFMGLIAFITYSHGQHNKEVFESVMKYCVPQSKT